MQVTAVGSCCESETDVLSRIVDAMLGVQPELQAAEDEEWSRILVDACRRQKAAAPREDQGACAAC